MPYTKPLRTAFAAKLRHPEETVVTLDSGENVAVLVVLSVEPNTGNTVVKVSTRMVERDGETSVDGNGEPIESGYSHNASEVEIAQMGGIDALVKQVTLVALGEPSTLLAEPIHTEARRHASIRPNIASAKAAGRFRRLGTVL